MDRPRGWAALLATPRPARAIELMSVRVAYEREIGHPDAEAHAERVEQIRRRMAGQA